jgi:hypothetical protein
MLSLLPVLPLLVLVLLLLVRLWRLPWTQRVLLLMPPPMLLPLLMIARKRWIEARDRAKALDQMIKKLPMIKMPMGVIPTIMDLPMGEIPTIMDLTMIRMPMIMMPMIMMPRALQMSPTPRDSWIHLMVIRDHWACGLRHLATAAWMPGTSRTGALEPLSTSLQRIEPSSSPRRNRRSSTASVRVRVSTLV